MKRGPFYHKGIYEEMGLSPRQIALLAKQNPRRGYRNPYLNFPGPVTGIQHVWDDARFGKDYTVEAVFSGIVVLVYIGWIIKTAIFPHH
jgi:hypothetical protein